MTGHALSEALIREDGYWPRVEACYSRTWDHYDMPPHYHDRVEVMYVMKGWCNIHLFEYVMDASAQSMRVVRHWTERMGPGEFMFLDQGVPHRLEVPKTNYMLNAEFVIGRVPDAPTSLMRLAARSLSLAALLNGSMRIIRGKDESGQLLHALDQVVREFSKASIKDQTLLDILVAELLLRLAGCMRNSSVKENVLSYARRAADYIEQHFSEEFHVADAAREVGVAPAYLQRVFKQAMGLTMVEYTNRLRVEQSKRLLIHTNEAIMDIAVASGFNSRQHFFRVFNALEGVSPQQFRQRFKARSTQQLYIFEDAMDYRYDAGAMADKSPRAKT